MTVSRTSSPPKLRVFAKVAQTAPPGALLPHVAAVVRFHLNGAHHGHRPLNLSTSSFGDRAPSPTPAPAEPSTVQRTFQFGELHAFLDAGRARTAVAGMLSLLPLDLEAECLQAWAGFISSVLCLAASRSRRRNLGGVIGIVRIEFVGAEGEEEGDGERDGFSDSAPVPTLGASFDKAEAPAHSAGEDGSSRFQGCSCPICYEALGHQTEVVRTPCGHGFHRACIGRWLRSRRTCPVCRFEMPKKVRDCEGEV